MDAVTNKGAIKTITTHYIGGTFVGSHGREVMDIINPTRGEAIAHVTLADEEDARCAIAAAKRAFVDFGRTTKGGARENPAPPARGSFGAHR
jgi:acyl-CoA reductase-like NAD-dependent aldehyde dehydrogenase